MGPWSGSPGPGAVLINGNITAKVMLSTWRRWYTGLTIWTLVLGKRAAANVVIIARLESPDSILDYYVVPAFSQLHGVFHVRTDDNAAFLEIYHFATLKPLIEAFGRCPTQELA